MLCILHEAHVGASTQILNAKYTAVREAALLHVRKNGGVPCASVQIFWRLAALHTLPTPSAREPHGP